VDILDIEIKTERLVLRVINESMAERVMDYFRRNHDFLYRWEPLRPTGFYTTQYHQAQLQTDLIRMDNDEMFRVWVFKQEELEAGRVIGSLAFNNIVRGCFDSCFLGYRLDKDEVNQGYMTEALRAFVEFGFERLNLHRVEANIIPRNKPSLRAAVKAGFYDEGLAQKYLKINGQWEDHVHMVIRNSAME